MRKRTIITIIITILVLIFTNKHWLIFRPMPIDFEISGNGNCNIDVQLNKKNNNEFKKIKTHNRDVNLDTTHHVYFTVNRIFKPKRFRIIFGNPQAPITIKNIQFRKGKFKPDLSKFVTEDGRLKLENETLTIYPEQELVFLNYTDSLNIRSAIKFDFKVFVIIFVLTFLFVYKISNYVADFKSIEKKSRIEIIFLTLFFVSLFIPMSYINQDDISKNENRKLAKWKPFITQNGEINYNFGKDVNEWFNDRFNLRNELLEKHTTLSIISTGKAEKGYIDNNGFIYFDGEIKHNHYKHISQKDFDALQKFDKFCKQNNIELYVLIVPDKGYIHVPSQKTLINDNYDQQLKIKVQELNEQYDMNIIFPLEELKNGAKNNYMFFKTEHHWTDDGAFVGYQSLMKEIVKNHKDIKVLGENDFNISYNNLVRGDWSRNYGYGQTSKYLNLPKLYIKKLHKTNYRYFTYKNTDNIKIKVVDTSKKKFKVYDNSEGADYRVIQLGTSQNENLTEFIPATFKNVLRLRNNNVKDISVQNVFKIIKYYKKQILDYKPDIIVFCITHQNIMELHNLFNEEEN